MSAKTYDLIVFGGGNAITVATEAGKAGWNVALVEKGPLGGTCPHRGCIPSKLLIGYADAAQAAREAGRFFVEADVGAIDHAALLEETFSYIGRFDGWALDDMPESVDLYRVHATFLDNRTLKVGDETITAPRLVLATGSRPRRLDLPGPYWTSDDVFGMERIPESITILGGGYIGCELAHFFDGVGVDTLLVQRGDKLLEREDVDTQRVFQKGFRVPTRLGSTPDEVTHDGERFHLRFGDEERVSEALLLAIGRVPNSDRIDIENTDLARDENGYIPVDDHLRTSVDGVYAVGDIKGFDFFTHAASFEASYLAHELLTNGDAPIEKGPVPHAVFTSPEIAGVGFTEQELREKGIDYLKAEQDFVGVSKGRAIKEEHGLAKVLFARDGMILGFHIVGEYASVLLHEVLPVMRYANDVRNVANLMHIHPSLSEVVRGATKKAAAQL